MRLDQAGVRRLAQLPRLILVCGRYEAIDERLLQAEVDEELSIGDYVLSGGELAAAIVIDAVGRLLDGALGDAESAQQDSFGYNLLDCGHWTRPERHELGDVPEILRSETSRDRALAPATGPGANLAAAPGPAGAGGTG